MIPTYLKLFIVGCVLTAGFIGSYLIYRKQLDGQIWCRISFKAVGIGIALSLVICLVMSLFLLTVVLGIAAIAFFADATRHDEKLEHMLVALAGGILIGVTSLASMILCCNPV